MMKRGRTLRDQRTVGTRRKLRSRTGRPRLSVFRSSRHISAQIIDDAKAVTLVAASDCELKDQEKLTKTKRAEAVGILLAERAKKQRVSAVMFDRGGYRYHGRVQALAEAARKGGLTF